VDLFSGVSILGVWDGCKHLRIEPCPAYDQAVSFSLKGGYHPMDEKRYLELRLKITTTGQLTASEVRELERFEGELIKKLTPEERVQKFEAACKWFGVKPSQILGNKENVP
jgi:hypothetical protein